MLITTAVAYAVVAAIAFAECSSKSRICRLRGGELEYTNRADARGRRGLFKCVAKDGTVLD